MVCGSCEKPILDYPYFVVAKMVDNELSGKHCQLGEDGEIGAFYLDGAFCSEECLITAVKDGICFLKESAA